MPTILLVDDDIETLRALAAVLGELGQVVAVSDGASAFSYMRERPFDLLVSDLRLPDISGISIISEARTLRPEVPALLLTGRAEMADLADAINRAHVYRYLPKPVDLDDLRRTATSALEALHLRREHERLHAELERSTAAFRTLYEAARELSQAPRMADVAAAALRHLARAVPYALGGVLVAPPEASHAALYVQAAVPIDPATMATFRERILAEHRARANVQLPEHAVRVLSLGPQALAGPAPAGPLLRIEVPLDVGQALVGAAQLLCTRAPSNDERRLVAALAAETAQALRRVEALTEAHAREVHAIVRSLADGILVVGVEQAVTLANPAARAFLGLGARDEAIDAGGIAARLGFDPFELLRAWEQHGAQLVRREVNAGPRTLDAVVSPTLGAAGDVTGLAIALRDVTAERELERRKEEFVSVVSHEMRTPLASIQGSLELLLRGYVGELTEKQSHYLKLARDGCGRLHGVVDDLLDMAKFETGRLDVELGPVDLASMLREVADHHHGAAIERGATLVCHSPTDVSEVVAGDVARLFQVLNNLFANALKFVRDGGVIEVALLRSQALNDCVGFTVWNTGPSVADAELEWMFEKFRQLPGARRRIGGTGLGLPISRGIMVSHGGRLWAKRGVRDGVRFVGLLPRASASDAARSPPLDLDALRVYADALAGREGLVLVAHADVATAWLMKGALLRYGVHAETAVTFEDLLEPARLQRASALVIDCALCGAGVERLREIGSSEAGDDVPAIVIVGDGAPAGLAKVVHLARSFSTPDLVRAVGRAVALRSMPKPMRVLLVCADDETRAGHHAAFGAAGVEVEAVTALAEAVAASRRRTPDAIVVDFGVDEGLGFDVAHALVGGRPDAPALLCIGAEAALAVKVRAFREGASDYVIRPIEPAALVERTRAVVARRQSQDGTPTTGLPGALAIERELRRRIARARPFAYLDITIDHLRGFADRAGYAKAEGLVRQVGELVREVLFAYGAPTDFAGHVERDHFVVVTAPSRVDAVGEGLASALERALALYDSTRDAAPSSGLDPAMPLSPRVVSILDHGGRFGEPAAVSAAARSRRSRPFVDGADAVYLRDDPPA